MSSLFAQPFSANPKPLPVLMYSNSNSNSTPVVKKCKKFTDCKNHIAQIDDRKDVVSSVQQEKKQLQITLDEYVICENNLSSLQSQLKNSERSCLKLRLKIITSL